MNRTLASLFLCALFLLAPLSGRAAGVDQDRPKDPVWNQFVVGSVDSLPDGATKKFLMASHFNNPYAAKLAKQNAAMGPFAPEANNVFWIPTIDVPVDAENWRFLSTLGDLPKSLMHLTVLGQGDQQHVRMFLHPYTTQEPQFIELANKFGGFKYEFQGATTASVRSFIAWKTSKPKPADGPGKLDFPTNAKKFVWPKVSVFRADIEGSRLNPAKKMVRAYAVTRLMDTISDKEKKEGGFDFSGEWVVGVPSDSDAGYVVREVLSQYRNNGTGAEAEYAEPAFSALSPKRLKEMTKGVRKPDQWVRDELFRPLAEAVAYLMMQEGMVGEYHTQNFSYVMDGHDQPTNLVLLHDADAFRTSIVLRTLNGRSTAPLRKIETPFFFLKDSVLTQQGGPNSTGYNPNGLIWDYVVDSKDQSATVGAILVWCKGVKAYEDWCTGPKLRKMFLEVMAKELSPYLKRTVSASELDYDGEDAGNVGLVKLFKERVDILSDSSEAVQGKADPKLQKMLRDEFVRLKGSGFGKSMSSNITLQNSNFLLNIAENNSASITVVSKVPPGNEYVQKTKLKGVALLGPEVDPGARKFAERIKNLAGIEIPMPDDDQVPVMRSLGGGSNRPNVPKGWTVPLCESKALKKNFH